MAKLTLADLANLNSPTSAVASINANNALVEAAVENTLSRDGTSPNSMSANLDMNSNHILNCPEITNLQAQSVSVTAATGNIVVTPSPGVSTFTIDLGSSLTGLTQITGPAESTFIISSDGLNTAGSPSSNIQLNTPTGKNGTSGINGGASGQILASTGAGGNTVSANGGVGGRFRVDIGDGGNVTSGNGDGGKGGNIELAAGFGGTGHGTGNGGQGGDIVLFANVAGTGGTPGRQGLIICSGLPTSDPHVLGALWNSSGTVHISAG